MYICSLNLDSHPRMDCVIVPYGWGNELIAFICFDRCRISILAKGNLRIWNATKPDAGLYTCIARNQFGVASSTGTLSVKGISSEFVAFEFYCIAVDFLLPKKLKHSFKWRNCMIGGLRSTQPSLLAFLMLYSADHVIT